MRLLAGLLVVLAAGWPSLAAPVNPAEMLLHADAQGGMQGDPLLAIVQRINGHFHRLETSGVTLDPRDLQNPTEEIRLTIVPQLLGYAALYKTFPTTSLHDDVVERADFLVTHFDEITSHSAMDGMLGYALLSAFEISGNGQYLEKASLIVERCKSLTGSRNTLNWGLMSAMALAKYHALTGDQAARDKTLQIISSLLPYQHADGSFPHWCPSSKDVHYTAWMAMELIIIRRYVESGVLDALLEKTGAFLEARVGDDGVTVYREPCTSLPNCWKDYWSQSGCPEDYDTRGWVNELGYTALVFDHFRRGKYHTVMSFLRELEEIGLFDDKWDYLPLPDDPLFPWVGDQSVIRTSVVFWSLAHILASRETFVPADYADAPSDASSIRSVGDGLLSGVVWPAESLLVALQEAQAVGVPRPSGSDAIDAGSRTPHWDARLRPVGDDGAADARMQLVKAVPNPTAAAAEVLFSLRTEESVSLNVLDLHGRVVRQLAAGRFSRGEHGAHWDGRDASGNAVPAGLYFVQLRSGAHVETARLVVIR